MIVIVDYEMGNVGSIRNMLLRGGFPSVISGDVEVIRSASKLILPGVGSFDSGMNNIERLGLRNILDHKALVEKIPILGICLGMQLLSKSSQEGELPGLGWIDAKTVKIVNSEPTASLRVPHMGWNSVNVVNRGKLYFESLNLSRFYFVHSYHVECVDPRNVIATTTYGGELAAIIERDNLFGAQFHPEKSHKFGLELLNQFARMEFVPC